MKVHVNINERELKVNEAFTGANADEVVGQMKARVSRELPFAMRLMVGAMSNLQFAQEVVKRYNEAQKQNAPIPASCEEFLQLAQAHGFATIEAT
jgi:hypothetical protein